ncbi:bifunctional DNA primase/polymerase [Agromyces sp. Marseille-Q5079]|uniref:bifunctional DNA primase/polymerase n=1 Tax=Agromyces sp. Marseille-Q5079 TaxID=3439059 RepID=UPI003D9C91EC
MLLVTASLSSRDAAQAFANAGVPVFPCVAGGKRPLTPAGFHDATTDHGVVAGWWSTWPNANPAVPTGAASGLDVVDVDVATDRSGFDAFAVAQEAGILDGEYARVRTPSGGVHVYFPAAADRPQRCWQSATAHIDFRGDGGYVVVPPSWLTLERGRAAYRLASLSSGDPHPVDAGALRSLIDPRSIRPRRDAASSEPSAVPSGGVDRERLAAWVARLREGERNHGLFWAACRLVETGLSVVAIEDALGPAAASAGLADAEIAITIRSAQRHLARIPEAREVWQPRPVAGTPISERSCRR